VVEAADICTWLPGITCKFLVQDRDAEEGNRMGTNELIDFGLLVQEMDTVFPQAGKRERLVGGKGIIGITNTFLRSMASVGLLIWDGNNVMGLIVDGLGILLQEVYHASSLELVIFQHIYSTEGVLCEWAKI